MAARECCPLITAFLALLFTFSGQSLAQLSAPAQLAGAAQTCSYQYAIPIGGNCVTYGPAVEQKMDAMKQDMDRVKLQFLSLTNSLQDQIHALTNKGSSTDTRLADLAGQISRLRDSVDALTGSVPLATTSYRNSGNSGNNRNNGNGNNNNNNSPNNEMLLQLMTATKAQLTADIQKLTSDISSLRIQLQYNPQQSGVEAELKAQISHQETEIETLNQGLANLHNMVTQQLQRLQALASNPQPGQIIPAASQLSADLKDVQKDLADVQSRVTSLEDSRRTTQQKVDNQSLAISDAATQLQFLKTRNNDLQKSVDKAIAIFPSLQSQVQIISQNVSGLTQQINTVGFNSLTTAADHRQAIDDLQTQMKMLVAQLASIRKIIAANGITGDVPTTTTGRVPIPRGANLGNVVVPTPRPRSGSGL